jgi:hypothetical protein
MKRLFIIVVVIFGALVFFGSLTETGLASSCMKTQQRHGMLDFRNTCSYPVTVSDT